MGSGKFELENISVSSRNWTLVLNRASLSSSVAICSLFQPIESQNKVLNIGKFSKRMNLRYVWRCSEDITESKV